MKKNDISIMVYQALFSGLDNRSRWWKLATSIKLQILRKTLALFSPSIKFMEAWVPYASPSKITRSSDHGS